MKRSLLVAIAIATTLTAVSSEAITHYKPKGYQDGGVVLRMGEPMGSVFNPGEAIDFRYQTLNDGFVVVFNIDTEGYVHLLAPVTGVRESKAGQNYTIPPADEKLLVSGATGVEFVFAITIPDRDFLDENSLDYLREQENKPAAERYRIDGDPFLAANMIAGELVRGISRRAGVFLDYTYFFVNDRVAYPCYLCGTCDGDPADPICGQYRVEADFDQETPLSYPLQRGYAMVDTDAPVADNDRYLEDESEQEEDDDVVVVFYPYRTEVRYVSRPWYGYDWYWYDTWDYDPFYSGWHYYPGSYPGYGWGWGNWVCGSNWGFRFTSGWSSWNWGWGCGGWWNGGWGGYYCSSSWYPDYHRSYLHHYDSYYDHSARGSTRRPSMYKSDLVSSRARVSRHDSQLRIASHELRNSSRTVLRSQARSRTSVRVANRASRSALSHGKTTRITNSRVKTTRQQRATSYRPRSSRTTRSIDTSRRGTTVDRRTPTVRSRKSPTRSTTGRSTNYRSTSRKSTSGSSARSNRGATGSKRSDVKSGGSRTSTTRSKASKAPAKSKSGGKSRSTSGKGKKR